MVLSFNLKNTGATYQGEMIIIFHDFLHNLVECYVVDLVVKTKDRENYPHGLRKVFEKLCKHQLKINPLKCVFKVTSREFLSFVV